MRLYVNVKLVLFCMLFSSMLIAQELGILKGTILNDATDIEGVTIVNLTRKIGVVASATGTFNIPIQVGDTLQLSAISYKGMEVIITEAVYTRETLSLYLTPKINELDEVVVSNIDLTGDLSKDIATMKYDIFIDPRDLGIPANRKPIMTVEERRFYGATGGAGLLGSLINAISGRTEMLKKHLEVARLKAAVQKNKNKFSDSLYLKTLQIPEDMIEDFVFYVFEDPNVPKSIGEDNIFEWLELLQQKAPGYIKLKEVENIKK